MQADADHLPFADGSFEVTTAVTLCEFTDSAEVTIAELSRVTRPGGQLVIGALNPRSPWGLVNRSRFESPRGRARSGSQRARSGRLVHTTATSKPSLCCTRRAPH